MKAKAFIQPGTIGHYNLKTKKYDQLRKLVYSPQSQVIGIAPETVYNVPEPLRQYPVYIVSPGIGDISWVYSKLCNLGNKFVMAVCDGLPTKAAPRYARSIPFARLLPNVAYVTNAFCDSEQAYVMSYFSNLGNGHIPKGGYICANKWLESGKSLKKFVPLLPTTKHFSLNQPLWAEDEADLFVKDEEAIAFYTSSIDYYQDCNLSIQDWIKLITDVSYKHPKSKIVLIGSPWDMNLMRPVYEVIKTIGFDRIEMVFDRDIAVSLAILRRCKFLIGCVSGLTIISEYQRIPTVHLYASDLLTKTEILGTWESEEMVANGLSLSIPISSGIDKILKSINEKFCPMQMVAV